MRHFNKKVNKRICEQVVEAFGGNFYEVIIGGAAFNREVEDFLHKIGFPYTVGYGTTECAPIIGYSDWHTFVPYSCCLYSCPANIPLLDIIRQSKGQVLGIIRARAAAAKKQ